MTSDRRADGLPHLRHRAASPYGDDVVALVIGDEWARVPAYLSRVRAVFRNLCARPNLGCGPSHGPRPRPSPPCCRPPRGARGAPGGRPHLRAEFAPGARRPRLAPQVELPIGTYNLLDLPLRPFDERAAISSSRAASPTHRDAAPPSRRGSCPRTCPARRCSGTSSGSAPRTGHGRPADDRRVQGVGQRRPRRLLERPDGLRIALVPRGATTETHRFFQALKYGCVVVTDAFPRAGSTRRRRSSGCATGTSWRVVMPLLADPGGWNAPPPVVRLVGAACSEEAVGRLMARTLNALA